MLNNTKIQYFTPGDVAEKLQLNPITIYGYIRSKKLSAIKIGRHYRVTSQDFDSFIEANKVI